MECHSSFYPFTILCCLLLLPSHLFVQASPRLNPFDKKQQMKPPVAIAPALEPRMPAFGNNRNSTDPGEVYVRVGGSGNNNKQTPQQQQEQYQYDPSITVATDCDVTYMIENNHTALVFSSNEFVAYKCTSTFRAAGEGSMLFMNCPSFRLRFNCYFEALTVTVNGTTVIKQYCGSDVLPPAVGTEINLDYKRNLRGFNGGYVCMITAKGPEIPKKNETVAAVGLRCGVPATEETKSRNGNIHRVVGGINANVLAWPWMVSLKMSVGRYNLEYRCGGSLIDPTHILTAAHCLFGYAINYIDVALGKHNLGDENEKCSIWRRTTQYVVHENYDDNLILHDIAIITLTEPITYSECIRPICLPPIDFKLLEKAIITAIGWGSLSYGGDEPEILQQVAIGVIPNGDCQDAWQNKFNDDSFDIYDSQLCAKGDGKDTCQGDSGGPVLYKDGDQWVQVGITSYGYKCADKVVPGVYTRVSEYDVWINEQIN